MLVRAGVCLGTLPGKLQYIDVSWQDQIGESDCNLFLFIVMLGGQGKTAIVCMSKEYWESTEWILAVFPCNLAAGNYYKLVS